MLKTSIFEKVEATGDRTFTFLFSFLNTYKYINHRVFLIENHAVVWDTILYAYMQEIPSSINKFDHFIKEDRIALINYRLEASLFYSIFVISNSYQPQYYVISFFNWSLKYMCLSFWIRQLLLAICENYPKKDCNILTKGLA